MVIDITLTCLSRISAAFLAGCCPFFSLNLHNTQSITATQLCRRPLARLHRARIECMWEKRREAPLYPHAFPKACPGPRSASALTPARAAPPHPATAPWLLLEDEKMRFAHFLILQ